MKKRDIRRLVRQLIQIVFFLWMPALYTSAFSGVRYVIEHIREGKPVEQNAFLIMLIALCGFTIIFGRFFCGFICAFGTLGDGMFAFSQWVQKKRKKRLPKIPDNWGKRMQVIKYMVVIVLIGIYALSLTDTFKGSSPWEVFSMLYSGTIPSFSYLAGWILFLLILIGMCMKERFFCQYLCPMGAIFAWLPVLPFSVLSRDREKCIPKCRACQVTCPVDMEIKRDQKEGGECIHCMQCMDVCPKQHISLGTGKKFNGNEIPFILIKLVLFILICTFAENL
ncbi:MAG: 4Fe-4S binding protein [Anaerostipes sp.]|jgi:ferredoxin-type protein NapH